MSSGPLPAPACYPPLSALPSGTLTGFSHIPPGDPGCPPACGIHVSPVAGEATTGESTEFPSAELALQSSQGVGE